MFGPDSLIERLRRAIVCRGPSIQRRLESWLGHWPSFIVVCSPRSGSGFVAAVLRESGIRCAHEGFFGPNLVRKRFGFEGEVSWMALPRLERGICPDVPMVHIVRHPVAVIRSLVGTGFFDRQENAYSRYMRAHFVVCGDPIDDAMRWYVEWNLRCEALCENRFQVEWLDDRRREFVDCLGRRYSGIDLALGQVSTRFNHRERAGIDLEQLSTRSCFNELVEIAERYGYELR